MKIILLLHINNDIKMCGLVRCINHIHEKCKTFNSWKHLNVKHLRFSFNIQSLFHTENESRSLLRFASTRSCWVVKLISSEVSLWQNQTLYCLRRCRCWSFAGPSDLLLRIKRADGEVTWSCIPDQGWSANCDDTKRTNLPVSGELLPRLKIYNIHYKTGMAVLT